MRQGRLPREGLLAGSVVAIVALGPGGYFFNVVFFICFILVFLVGLVLLLLCFVPMG
jgi:hypothetical protein